jgi:2-phosphoglycerate kinase
MWAFALGDEPIKEVNHQKKINIEGCHLLPQVINSTSHNTLHYNVFVITNSTLIKWPNA